MHPFLLVQEKHGSSLVLVIVPLFQSSEEVEASCFSRPLRPTQRHPHCHSVCLAFHLAGGNRTSVLLCVREDNREPAYSCCLTVRDSSCIQKFQSRCKSQQPSTVALVKWLWTIINRSIHGCVLCFDDA